MEHTQVPLMRLGSHAHLEDQHIPVGAPACVACVGQGPVGLAGRRTAVDAPGGRRAHRGQTHPGHRGQPQQALLRDGGLQRRALVQGERSRLPSPGRLAACLRPVVCVRGYR
jgi:hypothetical protein